MLLSLGGWCGENDIGRSVTLEHSRTCKSKYLSEELRTSGKLFRGIAPQKFLEPHLVNIWNIAFLNMLSQINDGETNFEELRSCVVIGDEEHRSAPILKHL